MKTSTLTLRPTVYTSTIGTNATLAERLKYCPGDIVNAEVFDAVIAALEELEQWRAIGDDLEVGGCCIDEPDAMKRYVIELEADQSTEDQKFDTRMVEEFYKPLWDDMVEAAGGAHHLGYPDVSEQSARLLILDCIERGAEVLEAEHQANKGA